MLRAGQPDRSVWRGEINAESGDGGRGVRRERETDTGGERGAGLHEAVSRPCRGFWKRSAAAKYHAAYFAHYPGVGRHGDYVELTEHDGVIIYGRSDATLNPGGVRIAPRRFYRQVEQIPEVVESLVSDNSEDTTSGSCCSGGLRDASS